MVGTPALAAAGAQLRYQAPLTAEVLACVQSASLPFLHPAFVPACTREGPGDIQQNLFHLLRLCASK